MTSAPQLIGMAWKNFMSAPKLFIGIYVVPGILALILSELSTDMTETTTPSIVLALTYLLVLVFALIANVLMGIGMIKAVASPQETTASSAYRFAKDHFFSYLWVGILYTLVVLLGFILLIIPGFIFLVWFMFSYFELIFNNKKGSDALKASKSLVKGKWWSVFIRFSFLVFIILLVNIVVLTLSSMLLVTVGQLVATVVTVLANAVIVPVTVSYVYFMYLSLKESHVVLQPAPVTDPGGETANILEPTRDVTPDETEVR